MLAELVGAAPAPPLRPFVSSYAGYHYRGFRPGVHIGLPSTALTVVISLDDPMAVTFDAKQPFAGFQALASGLHTKPAYISHEGTQFGVQLALTPAGSRALMGVPAAVLSAVLVDLTDLLGPSASELCERMAGAPGWARRFQLLDEILLRRLGSRRPADETVGVAWQRMVASQGSLRVADLAAQIGWSRRHLSARFQSEFGVGPKDAARIARFQRSHRLLQRNPQTLIGVAAECGYFDQAHMAREWRDLAGMAPSAWLAFEELPILPSPDGQ